MKYKKGKKIESFEEFARYLSINGDVYYKDSLEENIEELTISSILNIIYEGELFEAIEDKPAEFWLNEYPADEHLDCAIVGGRFFGGGRFDTEEKAEREALGNCGCIGQVKFMEVTDESC